MSQVSFTGLIALLSLGVVMAETKPDAVRQLDVKLEGAAKGKATEPTTIAS